jgi:hypothetical protein
LFMCLPVYPLRSLHCIYLPTLGRPRLNKIGYQTHAIGSD